MSDAVTRTEVVAVRNQLNTLVKKQEAHKATIDVQARSSDTNQKKEIVYQALLNATQIVINGLDQLADV